MRDLLVVLLIVVSHASTETVGSTELHFIHGPYHILMTLQRQSSIIPTVSVIYHDLNGHSTTDFKMFSGAFEVQLDTTYTYPFIDFLSYDVLIEFPDELDFAEIGSFQYLSRTLTPYWEGCAQMSIPFYEAGQSLCHYGTMKIGARCVQVCLCNNGGDCDPVTATKMDTSCLLHSDLFPPCDPSSPSPSTTAVIRSPVAPFVPALEGNSMFLFRASHQMSFQFNHPSGLVNGIIVESIDAFEVNIFTILWTSHSTNIKLNATGSFGTVDISPSWETEMSLAKDSSLSFSLIESSGLSLFSFSLSLKADGTHVVYKDCSQFLVETGEGLCFSSPDGSSHLCSQGDTATIADYISCLPPSPPSPGEYSTVFTFNQGDSLRGSCTVNEDLDELNEKLSVACNFPLQCKLAFSVTLDGQSVTPASFTVHSGQFVIVDIHTAEDPGTSVTCNPPLPPVSSLSAFIVDISDKGSSVLFDHCPQFILESTAAECYEKKSGPDGYSFCINEGSIQSALPMHLCSQQMSVVFKREGTRLEGVVAETVPGTFTASWNSRDKLSLGVVVGGERQNASGPFAFVTSMWKKLPMVAHFDFFLFNITNMDEVEFEGAEPRLLQVGPYSYEQTEVKEGIEWMEGGKLVGYRNNKTWTYDTGRSCPHCTENDVVILTSPAFVGAFYLKAKNNVHPFGSLLLEALLLVTGESPIRRVSVGGILLHSYSDPLLNVMNSPIAQTFLSWTGGNVLGIPIPEQKYIGFLPKYNLTSDENYVVRTGIENWKEVGKIEEWANRSEIPWLKGPPASFEGAGDGSFFSPIDSKDEDLRMFQSFIGRSIELFYSHEEEVQGIPTFAYSIDPEMYDTSIERNRGLVYPNEEEIEYFPGRNGTMPDGIVHLHAFPGRVKPLPVTIFLSRPHFLNHSKELQDGVVGLSPDEHLHSSGTWWINPMTGATTRGRFRLQLNLPLVNSDVLLGSLHLPTVMVPSAYGEVTAEMNEDTAVLFSLLTRGIPRVCLFIAVCCLVVAILHFTLAAMLFYRTRYSHRNQIV